MAVTAVAGYCLRCFEENVWESLKTYMPRTSAASVMSVRSNIAVGGMVSIVAAVDVAVGAILCIAFHANDTITWPIADKE